jgi:hypothetical protein
MLWLPYYSSVCHLKNNSIQGDSGGKVNILGGDSIGHCEKKVHTNMCLILNGYQDRAVWISRPVVVRFLFLGYEERSLQKKGECMRWIAGWHKERWRRKQTNNIEVNGAILEHFLWTVTNLLFKHSIKVKIKWTVSNFSFFINMHSVFVFVDWNSSISLTIQN